MKHLAPLLLLCGVAAAQFKPPTIETKGACSPVVTGNDNTITIKTCGMTKDQVAEWRTSFQQILAKQIDPKVLVALLDDIKSGANPH